jgi:hypothetical protein
VKLNAESMAIVERQLQAFREKFGREPGPDDPLFFDPDADTPQPFSLERSIEESARAMVAAGIRPPAASHPGSILPTTAKLAIFAPKGETVR